MRAKLLIASAAVLAMIAAGSRLLRATSQQPPSVVTTRKVEIGPVRSQPDPTPSGHSHGVKLELKADRLPGGRVKISATADVESTAQAMGHTYLWKLEFLPANPDTPRELKNTPVWSWIYDQTPVNARPGTRRTHEFTDTITLPKGTYRARVWMLNSAWEDSVDGFELWPQNRGHQMTSCRVVID